MSLTSRASAIVSACGLVTLIACGSSGPDSGFGSSGGDGSGDLTSGAGSSGGFGGSSSGGASSSGGQECAAQEAAATLAKRPVDIIFVIDNSGSMGGEITEVQNQINQNFASIIEKSGIDYRVIMLTSHGSVSSIKVCISAPLSGTNCSPVPPQPAETAKFFHHSQNVQSHDSLCRILDSFNRADEFNKHPNGYKDLLRKEALKVFVEITDDGVSTSCNIGGQNKSFTDGNSVAGGQTAGDAFDAALLALSPEQFGTPQKRNYVFHSIIAIADFDAADKTKAHPPSATLTTAECTPGAVDPGTGYQHLSKLTGGLRYPTCGLNYTTIFQEMAKGVIEGAILSCEFDVPEPPPGEKLDLATVVTRYTPGSGGAPVDFQQVATAADCGPNKFYVEADKIKLCPATCDAVRADGSAQIKVLFGCAPKGAN